MPAPCFGVESAATYDFSVRSCFDRPEVDNGSDEAVSMTLEEAMDKLESAGIEVRCCFQKYFGCLIDSYVLFHVAHWQRTFYVQVLLEC